MSAIVLSLLPHALALQPCQRWSTASAPRRASATIVANTGVVTDVATADSKYDIVVIGSGIGGLSTAALLASTGQKVAVCESHDAPGGAAHEWTVKGHHFESGPSLYAGLSPQNSPNPLKHVFQIIGEEPEWLTYDRWGTYLPEGSFAAAVGAEDFMRKLDTYGGPDARAQWDRLMARVEPLGEAIFAVPSAAVRADGWAAVTLLGRYGGAFAKLLAVGGASLNAPFEKILEEEGVTDPFIRNWLDMICFLLQGATTNEAPTTLMAYMLSDFYREGVRLDFPKGGTASIVDALVRGVTKHDGCHLLLNAHVDKVEVEDGRAVGVRVGGRLVRARKAVVSNADLWSTSRLVDVAAAPALAAELGERSAAVGRCASFLHLHLGIDGSGLPTTPSEAFPAQWAALDSWEAGVDAPRNLVLVSVPSLLDPSMAPEGRHVVHAYVPATEPYERWEGMERNSKEYREAKAEAVEVLWRAIERQIPDVRERADIRMAGTPLTHERFLRRDRGTYGAFVAAGNGQLPGQKTALPGLYCVGDSTFPGIGMPAVAASGLICAASLSSVQDHWRMLDKIRL